MYILVGRGLQHYCFDGFLIPKYFLKTPFSICVSRYGYFTFFDWKMVEKIYISLKILTFSFHLTPNGMCSYKLDVGGSFYMEITNMIVAHFHSSNKVSVLCVTGLTYRAVLLWLMAMPLSGWNSSLRLWFWMIDISTKRFVSCYVSISPPTSYGCWCVAFCLVSAARALVVLSKVC